MKNLFKLLCLPLILFILCVPTAKGLDEWNGSPSYSIVDGIRYEYTVFFAITHFPPEEVPIDNQEVNITDVTLNNGFAIPDVVTLPTRVHNSEYDIDVIFKSISPDLKYSLYIDTLLIPSGYECYWNNDNSYALPGIGQLFNVKEYITENHTKEGLFAKDGVLFENRGTSANDLPYLVQLPMLAEKINYHFPANTMSPDGVYYNSQLKYPLIFTDKTENLGEGNFNSYPFFGLLLPDKFKDQAFDIANSGLKAFEHLKILKIINHTVLAPKSLIAGIIPKGDNIIEKIDLFLLYANGYWKSKIEFLEFKTDVLPEIVVDKPPRYSYKRDIVTFVQPHLVEGFKQLQKDGLFPPNAVIEPTRDWLYLYPELDNGQWVNRQSQFIYAACRFGNSEITNEEWSTDNQQIATVDKTGIVTLTGGTGEVTVCCTLTDHNGETCKAERKLKVTEQGVESIESGIDESKSEPTKPSVSGVYNLQGIYVGDSTTNLPAGIYITDGKKVVVK